jgi:limonene-1,2-epoxide hydrolase
MSSASFRPRILRDAATLPTEPQAVVETFLAALAAGDVDTAAELLDDHVAWSNVGLPTVRGRARTMALLRPLARPGLAFEVYLHAIAANGRTVLTDRTDAFQVGRLRIQVWVNGHFDVHEGRIVTWRDSFDYLDALRAFVRGLAGAVVAQLRPAAPQSPDVAPGRH